MNTRELEFSVFCIESLAEKLHITGKEALELLQTGNSVLDHYIIPNYEVLHTQGKQYITEDLLDLLKVDGFACISRQQ